MRTERRLAWEGVQLTHIPTSASLGEAQRQGDGEGEARGDTGASLITAFPAQIYLQMLSASCQERDIQKGQLMVGRGQMAPGPQVRTGHVVG